MSWIRDLGATTPFISPSPERFRKSATKNGLLGDIPIVGPALHTIPFASFFDDRLKYPFLAAGRLLVSLVICGLLLQFTLSPQFADFTENTLLPFFAPAPVKTAVSETGNFFDDSSARLQVETQFLVDSGVNQLVRGAIREAVTGIFAAPFRFLFFYVVWSILFAIFGNLIAQRERFVLKRVAELSELGRQLVCMLSAMARRGQLPLDEVQRLQHISTSMNGGISRNDRLFLQQLGQRYLVTPMLNPRPQPVQQFAQPPRQY